MATASLDGPSLDRWYHLTPPQMFCLALQGGALAGAFCWQLLANFDAVKLLWSDPVGVRLGGMALVLAALNFAAFSGGCFLLNRLAASSWRGGALPRKVLTGLLVAVCVGCFYLPALFLVLVGPAAVSIQKTLLGT